MGGLADRGIVHPQVAADRPHYDLAGVEAHTNLHAHVLGAPDIVGVLPHGLLHAERRVAGAHGVVLVGERCTEEGHDPVTHHLVDRALVAVDRVHHPFEDGIEHAARLFGITIGEQFHTALE